MVTADESNRSLEMYIIVQFSENLSRMRAVRKDWEGKGSYVTVFSRFGNRSGDGLLEPQVEEDLDGGDGDRAGLAGLSLGLGGIGDGSFHLLN